MLAGRSWQLGMQQYQPTITARPPSETRIMQLLYSCAHKMSIRDPSKNGSPLCRDPQVENHCFKGID